ncbi:MAG: helix-turn-helix domain-containing protein [Endozoicomonas sp.]
MVTTNLTAFLTIVDTSSYSEPAEKLCLIQPAISKWIAALEDQLGTPFCQESGRQMLDLLKNARQ